MNDNLEKEQDKTKIESTLESDAQESSKPKTSMGKKKIAVLVASGIILGALLIVGYFWYNGSYFVKTEDSRVSADIISVTPQMAGRVLDIKVKAGDMVSQGEVLISLDTSSVMGSTDINLQTFSQSAGINAYKSEMVSPIAGKVIQINASEGQSVNMGQSVIIVANTNDLYIAANIVETKIDKVKVGQLVEVTIDGISGKKFIGKVDSISEAVNSVFSLVPVQSSNGNFTKVTQTIPIVIRLPELAQQDTKIGMNATIKIHVK